MSQQVTDNNIAAKKFLNQGNKLRQEKKQDEAISAYRRAIELNPNLYQPYHFSGLILAQKGSLHEAINLYNRAIELNPNFFWSYHCLSIVLLQQGELEQAIAASRQAINISLDVGGNRADRAKLYNQLGQAYTKKGDLDEAIQSYKLAIESDSTLAPAYENLGEILTKLKRWEQSITHHQKAIEIIPNSDKLYYNLGEALLKTGNITEATAAYRQSLQLNSDFAWSYHNLGYCLEQQGQIDDAIACYSKALKILPSLTPAYHKILTLGEGKQIQQDALDAIIESCKQKIQLNPDDSMLHIRLGDMLSKRGKRDEAIESYKVATYTVNLQHNPDFVNKYWHSGEFIGPNFIITGTMKGGTSSLYEYLIQHPQILPCSQKELHFFTLNFDKGVDWYLAQFPPISKEQKFITGEASPSYLDWVGQLSDMPRKVKNLFPDVKLIFLLRNPVDRAVSCHYHQMRIGSEHRSFEEAVTAELNQIQAKSSEMYKWRGALTAGLYYYKLKEWMKVFPQEQILILKSEDLYRDTPKLVNQVFDFLGLPSYTCSTYTKYNSGSYSSISEKLKGELSSFYEPHNQILEEYLGRKFNWN